MSCGIYILLFEGTDSVYIGQSTNIENRYSNHLNRLNSGQSNFKMLHAYNYFGIPSLEILEECLPSELNDKEKYYIKLFDSIENGLNIAVGGQVFSSGTNNPNSCLSEYEVEELFKFWYNNQNFSIKEISDKFNKAYTTIYDIFKCKSHIWLKEKYPLEYSVLESTINTRVKNNGKNAKTASERGIKYPLLRAPDGSIHEILCVSDFIRMHKLSDRLYNLLNYRVDVYKGWTRHER